MSFIVSERTHKTNLHGSIKMADIEVQVASAIVNCSIRKRLRIAKGDATCRQSEKERNLKQNRTNQIESKLWIRLPTMLDA